MKILRGQPMQVAVFCESKGLKSGISKPIELSNEIKTVRIDSDISESKSVDYKKNVKDEIQPTLVEFKKDLIFTVINNEGAVDKEITPDEVRLGFLREKDAKNLVKFNYTSANELENARKKAIDENDDPEVRVKDMVVTLMKGAATVGNILSDKPEEEELKWMPATLMSNGSYKIPSFNFTTDEKGTFYFFLNVRGIETPYQLAAMKSKLSQKENLGQKIFNFAESFFAFLLAVVIVSTAAYNFSVFIIPAAYLAIGVFSYYIWGKRDKGTMFLVVIYGFLGTITALLVLLSVMKIFYRNKMSKSMFFYARKMKMTKEYVYQLVN